MKHFSVIAYLAVMFTVFANPVRADSSEDSKNLSDQNRKENALSLLQKRDLDVKEEAHVDVGTRSSHADWVVAQEEKARIDAERSSEAESLEERSTIALEETEKADFEEVTSEEIIAKASYSTWHLGALHRPIAVTPLGDIVTLEDGSEWIVKYSNRYKTLDWLATDSIIVLPNHAWFSSHYFRLVNQMTGADIEVNLYKGPIYNGVYSHWIIAIDYYNCEIMLEDGTLWKVSSGEWSTMKKWLVNDTVILGINDSWFSSKPNILINVNMLNYVTAGPSQVDYILLPILTP